MRVGKRARQAGLAVLLGVLGTGLGFLASLLRRRAPTPYVSERHAPRAGEDQP